eukprot:9250427-Alexandrium_andersonii.AAC.1
MGPVGRCLERRDPVALVWRSRALVGQRRPARPAHPGAQPCQRRLGVAGRSRGRASEAGREHPGQG